MRKYLLHYAETASRQAKQRLCMLADLTVLYLSLRLAYAVRFGSERPLNDMQQLLALLAPLPAPAVFERLGVYRAVARHFSERSMRNVVLAVSVTALLWVGMVFLSEAGGAIGVPRSVPLLYWAFGLIGCIGMRFAVKRLLQPVAVPSPGNRILIYGAGAAGRQLAAALRARGGNGAAGFLDDDPQLHGRDVAGLRVYAAGELAKLISKYGIREVIVCIPSLNGAERRRLLTELQAHPVRTRLLPPLADIAAGKYPVNRLRNIEIDDLLGRSSVPPDPALLQQMITGQTVAVTGAGGSIGRELCRLIARNAPKRIILIENNEHALYKIDRELHEGAGAFDIVSVLGSVTDPALMREVLTRYRPGSLYHAAAHKHVPLLEDNVCEAVRNNVLGTYTLAEAAFDTGVRHFVLISTDKAVHPGNVMGAAKRCAELIVRHFAERTAGDGRRFCAVRFGNVLGSNGSVVPLFQEQIATGGPVTLTDPNMTRYFMSIHEAAELIVQAAALSQGSDVLLLDMGEPVRIEDLALNMIRLAGLGLRSDRTPEGDIALSVIGIRPGEKLHEELFYDPSKVLRTKHAKIMRSPHEEIPGTDVVLMIEMLQSAIAARDTQRLRGLLFRICDAAGRRTLPRLVDERITS